MTFLNVRLFVLILLKRCAGTPSIRQCMCLYYTHTMGMYLTAMLQAYNTRAENEPAHGIYQHRHRIAWPFVALRAQAFPLVASIRSIRYYQIEIIPFGQFKLFYNRIYFLPCLRQLFINNIADRTRLNTHPANSFRINWRGRMQYHTVAWMHYYKCEFIIILVEVTSVFRAAFCLIDICILTG